MVRAGLFVMADLNKTHNESDRMCSCGYSVVYVPDSVRIERWDGTEKSEISVDACIAHVVSHLWSLGIKTLNCCCGHKKQNPSIIFDDGMTDDEAMVVEIAIAQVDEREFDLLSWRLVKVNQWQK